MEEIKLNKCIYIEDICLERLSSVENLQASLYMMEVVSCGNVTDKGIIALHKLRLVVMKIVFFIQSVKAVTQRTNELITTSLQELGVSVSQ